MNNEEILTVLHRAVGWSHGSTVADCISYRFRSVSGDVDMDWFVYEGFQRPMFQFEYRAILWAEWRAKENDPNHPGLEDSIRSAGGGET